MARYGTGLYFNGTNIAVNTRYSSDTAPDAALPDSENIFKIFDYDTSIGILNIHTVDLLKVDPDSNWKIDEHFHSYYEIHIIPKGRGEITLDEITFSVGPGQFYLTGPYVKHIQVSDHDDPMTEYCMQFDIRLAPSGEEGTGFQAELNNYRAILGTSYPRPFDDIYSIYSSFDQIFSEVQLGDIAYELKVQTLISDILIGAMRTVARSVNRLVGERPPAEELNSRVAVIRNFVESNYAERISIHDLKNILFLSTKQIDRIMIKETGGTFHSYLSEYRYRAARRLIEETGLSLNEIALKTGLSGEAHLHKVFKKYDTHSPGYYRKKG